MSENEIARMFDVLNKNKVNYCVLRSYEELSKNDDIDVLVNGSVKDIKNLFMENGFTIIKKPWRISDFFCIKYKANKWIKFHITNKICYGVGNFIVLKGYGKSLLSTKRKYQNIYIPSEEDELLLLAFRAVFERKGHKEKHIEKINSLNSKKLDMGYVEEQTNNLIPRNSNLFLEKIKTPSELLKLKNRIARELLVRNLQETLKRLGVFGFGKIKYVFRKKHISIAILGVDGAGKTTLIEHLIDYFGKDAKVVYMGHKMFILPTFQYRDALKKTLPSNTGITKELKDMVKFTNNFIEKMFRFTGSYIFEKRRLVLFDRYVYDEWVLKKNSKGIVNSISKKAWFLFPRPDYVIILDGSPEELYQRKKEHSLDYIREQRENFLHLSKKLKNSHVINSGKGQQRVFSDTLNIIAKDFYY